MIKNRRRVRCSAVTWSAKAFGRAVTRQRPAGHDLFKGGSSVRKG